MCILFHTGNTVVVRLGSLTVAATHHGEVMYVADRHLLLGTSVVVLYQKRCDEYYALYPNQRQEFGHPCTDVRVNQSLGFECVKGYTITIIVENSSGQQLASMVSSFITQQDESICKDAILPGNQSLCRYQCVILCILLNPAQTIVEIYHNVVFAVLSNSAWGV